MQRGDIAIGSFPFGDKVGAKLRPVLLLTNPVGIGTEVIVAYISSVVPALLLASDILLDAVQYPSTRLKVVSVLRLHKIATIHTSSLQRQIGRIDLALQQQVEIKMRAILKL